jgi:NADH-quinone oxidoreductase subunit L
VPLAPLVGAILAGVGTAFGGNRIGRRLSHTVHHPGRVLVAFVLSAMTLKSVAMDGARFNETSTPGWWWAA